jgi:hypothetical protein
MKPKAPLCILPPGFFFLALLTEIQGAPLDGDEDDRSSPEGRQPTAANLGFALM